MKPMRGALCLMVIFALAALGCAGKQKTETKPLKDLSASTKVASKEIGSNARVVDADGSLEMVPIYYKFDSDELMPESQEQLKKVAAYMRDNSAVKIMIEGHCDDRGTAEYNLALGERRARSAQRYLVYLGVTEAQLLTITYGEERPAVAGTGEDVWTKNRRAEFVRN